MYPKHIACDKVVQGKSKYYCWGRLTPLNYRQTNLALVPTLSIFNRHRVTLLSSLKHNYVIWNPIEPKLSSPKLSGLRVLCHLKGSLRIVSASLGCELTRPSTCFTISFSNASFWGVNSNFPLPYSLTDVPWVWLEIVAPMPEETTNRQITTHRKTSLITQCRSRDFITLWFNINQKQPQLVVLNLFGRLFMVW